MPSILGTLFVAARKARKHSSFLEQDRIIAVALTTQHTATADDIAKRGRSPEPERLAYNAFETQKNKQQQTGGRTFTRI
jgi:hypothetical protein